MPKKRKKAAKKTKRKAAKKTKKKAKKLLKKLREKQQRKLRKKQKRLKKLKKEKDSNLLIFTKNASHYKLYERRFFYSSKFSSESVTGSSTGNSVVDDLGVEVIG